MHTFTAVSQPQGGWKRRCKDVHVKTLTHIQHTQEAGESCSSLSITLETRALCTFLGACFGEERTSQAYWESHPSDMSSSQHLYSQWSTWNTCIPVHFQRFAPYTFFKSTTASSPSLPGFPWPTTARLPLAPVTAKSPLLLCKPSGLLPDSTWCWCHLWIRYLSPTRQVPTGQGLCLVTCIQQSIMFPNLKWITRWN